MDRALRYFVASRIAQAPIAAATSLCFVLFAIVLTQRPLAAGVARVVRSVAQLAASGMVKPRSVSTVLLGLPIARMLLWGPACAAAWGVTWVCPSSTATVGDAACVADGWRWLMLVVIAALDGAIAGVAAETDLETGGLGAAAGLLGVSLVDGDAEEAAGHAEAATLVAHIVAVGLGLGSGVFASSSSGTAFVDGLRSDTQPAAVRVLPPVGLQVSMSVGGATVGLALSFVAWVQHRRNVRQLLAERFPPTAVGSRGALQSPLDDADGFHQVTSMSSLTSDALRPQSASYSERQLRGMADDAVSEADSDLYTTSRRQQQAATLPKTSRVDRRRLAPGRDGSREGQSQRSSGNRSTSARSLPQGPSPTSRRSIGGIITTASTGLASDFYSTDGSDPVRSMEAWEDEDVVLGHRGEASSKPMPRRIALVVSPARLLRRYRKGFEELRERPAAIAVALVAALELSVEAAVQGALIPICALVLPFLGAAGGHAILPHDNRSPVGVALAWVALLVAAARLGRQGFARLGAAAFARIDDPTRADETDSVDAIKFRDEDDPLLVVGNPTRGGSYLGNGGADATQIHRRGGGAAILHEASANAVTTSSVDESTGPLRPLRDRAFVARYAVVAVSFLAPVGFVTADVLFRDTSVGVIGAASIFAISVVLASGLMGATIAPTRRLQQEAFAALPNQRSAFACVLLLVAVVDGIVFLAVVCALDTGPLDPAVLSRVNGAAEYHSSSTFYYRLWLAAGVLLLVGLVDVAIGLLLLWQRVTRDKASLDLAKFGDAFTVSRRDSILTDLAGLDDDGAGSDQQANDDLFGVTGTARSVPPSARNGCSLRSPRRGHPSAAVSPRARPNDPGLQRAVAATVTGDTIASRVDYSDN